MPSDTTAVRDEAAKLIGWKYVPSVLGWYLGGLEEKHRCYVAHPIPDTLDAAVAIIEEGGWGWERDSLGIQLFGPKQIIAVPEAGNLRLDFFTAALAKLKYQKDTPHAE